jgi:hypothetical protein
MGDILKIIEGIFEEIRYEDIKVGDRLIFTFHNGLMREELVARSVVVVEKDDGFTMVQLGKDEEVQFLLQPGNVHRSERYYRRGAVEVEC